MPIDPLTLGMFAVLGVMVFFMFRNNRKRQAEQRALQEKLVPGARVMTNFGLYGTLISIDEVENIAVLEVLSGARVELHRQTVARVIDPVVEEETPAAEAGEATPQFGERTPDAE